MHGETVKKIVSKVFAYLKFIVAVQNRSIKSGRGGVNIIDLLQWFISKGCPVYVLGAFVGCFML